MTYYSFEKYMDDAIRVEHSMQSTEPEAQNLIIEPTDVELGDLSLTNEVKIVAKVLAEAEAEHTDLVGGMSMAETFGELHPNAVHTGWILTNLSLNPQYQLRDINAGTPIYAGLVEPIMLAENGILYYLKLNIDPFRPGRGMGYPDQAVGQICDPEHTLEENKERIRYGLARLVARHELELPNILEETIESIT